MILPSCFQVETGAQFFQTQFYSMRAGNLTTIWNIASGRSYALNSIRVTCLTFIFTLIYILYIYLNIFMYLIYL